MADSTLTLRLSAYAPDAKQSVADAQALADARGHAQVEPLHLMAVMLLEGSELARAVAAQGADAAHLCLELEDALRLLPSEPGRVAYLSERMLDLLARAEGHARRAREGAQVGGPDLRRAAGEAADGGLRRALRAVGLLPEQLSPQVDEPPKAAPRASVLTDLGRDLCALAREGALDPVVGRTRETRRVLEVLSRSRVNHPLLIGERGVGKTAIVHALAQRLHSGDVPHDYRGRTLIELDLSILLAGAKLKGEAEQRMRSVLDAVRVRAADVILFLPQLAPLTADRVGGAAQLLRAALERRELQLIARATPDEARAVFAADPGLEAAFVAIQIEPPTIDEAIGILRGLAPSLERAHGLRITDPALVSAVRFARRYVPSASLPKSAIDLVDEAAARVRVRRDGVPETVERLERRLIDVDLERRSVLDESDSASRLTLEALSSERARLEGDLARARSQWEHQRDVLDVTEEDAAEVVASWTGVPVARMLEDEAAKLLAMEERLASRVKGQGPAIDAIARAVRRGRVGLRDAKRPIGSFLFLGPSGVGKTELAKALAEFLFDDEQALTRLDMSEFMERHAVARLIGSPPGYVDSEEGGFLTEAVRRRPYSVLLFDEVEKAHPDVFDILLQVLEDGRLSDSRGRLAFFADTVIILTSNLGGRAILDAEEDDGELERAISDALRAHFRPEFLNRLDEVIVFSRLDKPVLLGIAELMLASVKKMVALQGLTLEVEDAARAQLVELGYEPAFGARPLRRAIQRHIQDPLAEAILAGRFAKGATVRVTSRAGAILLEHGYTAE